MDLLNELDKLINRNNESNMGSDDIIPLNVLLRQPEWNNVTSIEVGGQFVRSVPEVVAILVAYSIVIILSLFGNSLVSTFGSFYRRYILTIFSLQYFKPLESKYPYISYSSI